jgi:hypothetical protein
MGRAEPGFRVKMFVASSRFVVRDGMEVEVRLAFRSRPDLVDDPSGFHRMDVPRRIDRPDAFCPMSWWADAVLYHRTERSPRAIIILGLDPRIGGHGHRAIPGGTLRASPDARIKPRRDDRRTVGRSFGRLVLFRWSHEMHGYRASDAGIPTWLKPVAGSVVMRNLARIAE